MGLKISFLLRYTQFLLLLTFFLLSISKLFGWTRPCFLLAYFLTPTLSLKLHISFLVSPGHILAHLSPRPSRSLKAQLIEIDTSFRINELSSFRQPAINLRLLAFVPVLWVSFAQNSATEYFPLIYLLSLGFTGVDLLKFYWN